MSRDLFNDNCDGCRPAIIEPSTGKVLDSEHPVMKALDEFWKTTTWDERFNFHQLTCLNSREPGVMSSVKDLSRRMQHHVSTALEPEARNE